MVNRSALRTGWIQHRATARRRRQIKAATRAEFDLERFRGIAAWRALASNVGELERARIAANRGGGDATSIGLPAQAAGAHVPLRHTERTSSPAGPG